jgi:DNA repair exonuclease SbcCD ATPase subunit
VDLERYARLHERADERRKALKAHVESLQTQLEAAPEVDAQEFAAVEVGIADATSARDGARAEVERWQGVEFQAQRWAELQARRAVLDQRWQQAQALLNEAEAIERDLDRLHDLRAALPHVEAAIKFRADFAESEKKSAALRVSHHSYKEKLEACDSALGQAQQKRASLQKSLAQDEQRQRALVDQVQRLTALLAKVEMYEVQQREVARLEGELAKLPADLDAELDRARQAHDDLAVLARAVPGLSRLQLARAELVATRSREAAAVAAESDIKAEGERLTAELSVLGPRVELLAQARARADEQVTEARTLLKHARDQLKAFRELHGAKVCRQCGQPLTAAHYAQEVARREAEAAAAEARLNEAVAAQKAAADEEQTQRGRHDALERQRQSKREEYRDARRQCETARAEITRLAADCAREYGELPEPYRCRVSPSLPDDWAATAYPTTTDVAEARRAADGLGAAQRRLEQMQRQSVQAGGLRDQLARARQHVDVLAADLPGEPAEVRRDFERGRAEDEAIGKQLQARRDEARRVQDELDRLTREREKYGRQVGEFEGQLRDEETNRRHWERSLETARAALPAGWAAQAERAKLAELHVWKAERDDLTARGVEQRAAELRQARSGLESLRSGRAELERDADAIPEPARRPVGDVQAAVRAAKQLAAECDARLRDAEQQKVILEARQSQRARLQEQLLATDREHHLQAVLAQLLGRDRLQLYLVRRAERQIVDHANAVLDRLSGGQLALRLRGGDEGEEADKALELEAYNRSTGGAPINVAFLSGSQRFRVAVALALGIGQYASRQHRPIQSVIIDEGFGCLDRNGRQVMIQELQNLREHLHCILLVSHQEEFAEAFADGYRFELDDGTTRVARIQR